MKKKKILVTSLIATLMSVSLITGATYSLFTSESTHNITVTSGIVNVESSFGTTLTYTSLDVLQTENKFANGGTATIDPKTGNINLVNITPGDKLGFTLKITNNSNIKVKYRVRIERGAEPIDSSLVLEGAGAETWTDLDVNKSPVDTEYSLLFVNNTPEHDNDLQGKTTTVKIIVEAIQYNAPQLQNYTITFDSQGGSEVGAINQIFDSKVEKPTDPTFDGHEFGGWYTDKECTEQNKFTFDENTKMPMKNITLYAKWTEVAASTYNVTLNTNEGVLPEGQQNTIAKEEGATLNDLPEPYKENFNFLGWYSTPDFQENSKITSLSTMPANELSLYANYEANDAENLNFTFNEQTQTYQVESLKDTFNYYQHPSNFVFPSMFDNGINKVHEVTTFKDAAFGGKNNLAEFKIIIPSTYKAITNNCFFNTYSSGLALSEGLETIGESAFVGIQATNVVIPDTVTSIGKCAFESSNIQSLTLSKNLTTLGENAFLVFNKITSLYIPSGIINSAGINNVAFGGKTNFGTQNTTIYLEDLNEETAWKEKIEAFTNPNVTFKAWVK